MCSTLRIDSLIRQYIHLALVRKELINAFGAIINHWDCQDTDDDNATECYFYVSNNLDKNNLNFIKKELANILGVDVESAIIEDQTKDGNPEIRIEFIVEIGNRNGRKFE